MNKKSRRILKRKNRKSLRKRGGASFQAYRNPHRQNAAAMENEDEAYNHKKAAAMENSNEENNKVSSAMNKQEKGYVIYGVYDLLRQLNPEIQLTTSSPIVLKIAAHITPEQLNKITSSYAQGGLSNEAAKDILKKAKSTANMTDIIKRMGI